MNRNIYCAECIKFLFETDKKSDGAAGVEAQHKGFVFKIASLFSDQYGCLFFCNSACQISFYDKNIPKNEKVSKALSDLKKEIPHMAQETCKKLQKFADIIRLKS